MEGIFAHMGASQGSLGHGARPPPVRLGPVQTGIQSRSDDKEDAREEDLKASSRPSILNPDKEGLEATQRLEAAQKVVGAQAPAEAPGLLGATIDVSA